MCFSDKEKLLHTTYKLSIVKVVSSRKYLIPIRIERNLTRNLITGKQFGSVVI